MGAKVLGERPVFLILNRSRLQQHFDFNADYVRRLQQGDADTEAHFCQYFGDLVRFKAAARLRGAKDAADDVRQETLMRSLRSIRNGGVEHPERLGAFVNAVCGNVLLELFRRNQRLAQFPEETPDTPSDAPSAEFELLQDERRTLVRRALDDLSPKDAELLRRIFLLEHNKDEVCKEFGVSREYLRVLLHRARARLKTALDRGRTADAK